jgi:hypothetical protein
MSDIAEAIRQQVRRFYERMPLPPRCVWCFGTRLGPKDNNVPRSASFLVDGEVVFVADLPGRRVRCLDCNRSWRHRPPGLIPRRHYQLCIVADGTGAYLFEEDATIEGVAERCCCSRWTVARWPAWLGWLASPADLQARLVELADAPILAPLRPVADLARKARRAARRLALALAAEVLCLLEAVAQVAGLEPPGLRAVVEAVVDDRDRVTTYAFPGIPEFAHRKFGGRL